MFIDHAHHYEIAETRSNGTRNVIVRRRIGDLSAIVAQERIPDGLILLRIEAERLVFRFAYAPDDQAFHELATGATRYLSSEVAGVYAKSGNRMGSPPATLMLKAE